MSLTIGPTKSAPTNEVTNINLKGSVLSYTPGNTITYTLLSTGDEAIYSGLQALDPDLNSATFLGNIWTNNPSWTTEVAQASQSANKIIDLTLTFEPNATNSDLRWVAVSDPSQAGLLGFAYLPSSSPEHDKLPSADVPIVIYDIAPWHSGNRAESEVGGGNERGLTILHELGHFLGLKHPHNNFASDAPFTELNDQKYDVMSYKDSERDRKLDTIDGSLQNVYSFGSFVNFSPTNIAALQYLYGANTNSYLNNNTYTLTDAGTVALDIDGTDGNTSIGRAYYSIWDNGGTDQIVYNGANNVLINLNDATLLRSGNNADLVETLARFENTVYYSSLNSSTANQITDARYYAGGFFSQILTTNSGSPTVDLNGLANTLGGYAIANGVTIENATGSSGNDILIGNQANNVLTGNGGNDTIFDANGDDTVYGNQGNDLFYVGRGTDSFFGGTGTDIASLNSASIRYFIEINGSQVTITDIIDNKYGINTFSDVETFTFAHNTFAFADLIEGNQYEREYAADKNNDFVKIPNIYNDIFWGTSANDNLVATLQNDLYKGNTGTDTVTFKGNLADFSFTTSVNNELIITNNTDNSLYDVLHSIEQLTFDDQTLDVATLTAPDLSLTAPQFTTWQTDYELG